MVRTLVTILILAIVTEVVDPRRVRVPRRNRIQLIPFGPRFPGSPRVQSTTVTKVYVSSFRPRESANSAASRTPAQGTFEYFAACQILLG